MSGLVHSGTFNLAASYELALTNPRFYVRFK
jgi:hypothetical protein